MVTERGSYADRGIIHNAMSNIDPNARYMKSHEWARLSGDVIMCGISDHAQEAMGDLVYVELPQIDQHLAAGEAFGVVESVKAASDVYMPVSGTVIAINETLSSAPENINKDPYQTGWMIQVKPDNANDLAQLMDAAAYEALLKEAH